MKDIEIKLDQKEEELIDSNFNQNIQIERDNFARILYNIIEEQKEGAKIRSRARWVEDSEKSTKYFYNLEKKNISIKQLKNENGDYATSNKDILEEQYTFYKKLYESDNISENNVRNYLNKINNLNKLSEQEAELLVGKITEIECKHAIKNIKLNKSPGSHGIPAEFYISFWENIKQILLESLNSAYQIGELSPTQKSNTDSHL